MSDKAVIAKQEELIEKYADDLIHRIFKSSIREKLQEFAKELSLLQKQGEKSDTITTTDLNDIDQAREERKPLTVQHIRDIVITGSYSIDSEGLKSDPFGWEHYALKLERMIINGTFK